MAWAKIPAWQQSELEQLSASGQLSGVDPQILAAIDQAESSGQGGGLNSAGYGGWFGLAPNRAYPGGNMVSTATLTSTTPTAYAAQAQTAAAEFASLLKLEGGDPLRAESAYQQGPNAPYTGSGEGVDVFRSLGIGGTQTGYAVTPATGGTGATLDSATTSAGGGWPSGDLTLVPGFAGWPGIKIGKSTLTRAGLMIVGLILLIIGLHALTQGNAGAGPITVVRTGASNARRNASRSDGANKLPGLENERRQTQQLELANRRHKATTAIAEREKKSRALDDADAEEAHARRSAAANEADPEYQRGAAGFRRTARARHRALGDKVKDVGFAAAAG